MKLPISKEALKPNLINYRNHNKFVTKSTNNMKYYHDRGTKVLTPLKEGDKVYYKKTPSSSWMPAKVTKVGPSPRSFIVTSPEGIDYRRNRHHILKPNSTNDEPNNIQEKKDPDEKQDLSGTSSPNLSNCIPEKPSSSNGITTRSGRKIIKPRRFTFTEDDASID
ncbi:hypothetical protein QE152_g27045 [Popillia japonica]|uniref:Uncharacterized protein n=1 Tax=Popillia japonica TaxID=7064 RepID=A0AAW1JWP8_POPJA